MKEEKKILTIIIPMYNSEKYIEKCVLSTQNQGLPSDEYEVIIVNDGSQDNSGEIAHRLANEYNNIHIITQKNGGLSRARNTGIKNAQGNYLFFLDSDDWISENCLFEIKQLLAKEPDILRINAVNVLEGVIIPRKSDLQKKSIRGKDFLFRDISPCATFNIIKKDFLLRNNLFFMEGILHEDSEFTPRLLYLAGKVSFCPKAIYYARQTPNSISRAPNPKRSFDIITHVCPSLLIFTKEYVDREYKQVFKDMICMNINNAFDVITFCNKYNQEKINCLIYNNKQLVDCLISSSILKYKIEGLLIKICPQKAVQIYKLLKLRYLN